MVEPNRRLHGELLPNTKFAINPFAFRANDEKMKLENAPHYIPPKKRKYIKDYMEQDSINLSPIQNRNELAANF